MLVAQGRVSSAHGYWVPFIRLCQVLLPEDGSSTPQPCSVLNHISPYLTGNTDANQEFNLKYAIQRWSNLWLNKSMFMKDCWLSDPFLISAWLLESSISDIILARSFHGIVFYPAAIGQYPLWMPLVCLLPWWFLGFICPANDCYFSQTVVLKFSNLIVFRWSKHPPAVPRPHHSLSSDTSFTQLLCLLGSCGNLSLQILLCTVWWLILCAPWRGHLTQIFSQIPV